MKSSTLPPWVSLNKKKAIFTVRAYSAGKTTPVAVKNKMMPMVANAAVAIILGFVSKYTLDPMFPENSKVLIYLREILFKILIESGAHAQLNSCLTEFTLKETVIRLHQRFNVESLEPVTKVFGDLRRPHDQKLYSEHFKERFFNSDVSLATYITFTSINEMKSLENLHNPKNLTYNNAEGVLPPNQSFVPNRTDMLNILGAPVMCDNEVLTKENNRLANVLKEIYEAYNKN